MAFKLSIIEHYKKVLSKFKKIRCTTANSHVNSSKSKTFNTSNMDNFMGNLNLTHISVHNKNFCNTIITLQTETYTESIISINDEVLDENNKSKKYHLIKIQQN